MKKAIAIIILGLLWCNIGVAATGKYHGIVDKYLSDRKLESVEGVWEFQGWLTIIYKVGNEIRLVTEDKYHNLRCNGIEYSINKVGENFYTYSRPSYEGEPEGTFDGQNCRPTSWIKEYTMRVNGNLLMGQFRVDTFASPTFQLTRVWPTDINSHNAKFKTKEDIAEDDRALAVMVNDAKKTCKVLGFEDGSEKMADCALKLYTQKVDELVATRTAANEQNLESKYNLSTQQTTTQQSSGSNTMTIYDPVRDSQRMKDQGMGMIMGRCKFGYSC